MSRFRLAALDLDGTLVDSAPDLSHCLGQALASAGLDPPSLASTRRWIGDGVEALVRRGLAAGLGHEPEPAAVTSALSVFDRCYAANLFVSSRVYPGVEAALLALRDGGLHLACVTNKRERFAHAMLEKAGLAACLDLVIGGDTLAHRKPHPEPLLAAAARCGVEPAQCAMVGDSVNDRDAAVDAGFTFVFAAYGYADPDDPALNRSNPVIDSFSALPGLLCG